MHSSLYHYLGVVHQKQNNIDDAVASFQKALAFDQSNITSAYCLASCENLRGNFAKALDDYKHALDTEKEIQQMSLSFNKNRTCEVQPLQLASDMDIFEKVVSPSADRPHFRELSGNNNYKKFFEKKKPTQHKSSE